MRLWSCMVFHSMCVLQTLQVLSLSSLYITTEVESNLCTYVAYCVYTFTCVRAGLVRSVWQFLNGGL